MPRFRLDLAFCKEVEYILELNILNSTETNSHFKMSYPIRFMTFHHICTYVIILFSLKIMLLQNCIRVPLLND